MCAVSETNQVWLKTLSVGVGATEIYYSQETT